MPENAPATAEQPAPRKRLASTIPPPSPPSSSNVRWLFLGICGALLALLLVSGVLVVRFLDKIQAQELAVTGALAERAQMLAGLSLSIQSYNQALEQFVAQAKADSAAVSRADRQPSAPLQLSRQQLEQLALEIDADLNRYPVSHDSAEEALLDELRAMFSEQRTVYVAVVERPDKQRPPAPNLTRQIEPLQKKIADWSSRLRTWNGERIESADQSLAQKFAGVQTGLTRTLAIGFGSGLLLVLAGTAYIVRLERQTQSRYLQLAQSQGELQQLSARLVDAQETERQSIARELHDEVGQSLGALLVDLGRLSTVLSHDALLHNRPEVKAQLDNMKSVAERTFQEVRDIALLLRPSMLDDLGLVAALEWQGREVSRRSEIEVEVQAENVAENLPGEYGVCIYRLVQEALNNAVRHSGARNAKVAVRQSPQNIQVQVSDDGHGFNAGRTRGLGLLGMEERIKRLAGTLTVQSKPGAGTTLTAELPLPPADGGRA